MKTNRYWTKATRTILAQPSTLPGRCPSPE